MEKILNSWAVVRKPPHVVVVGEELAEAVQIAWDYGVSPGQPASLAYVEAVEMLPTLVPDIFADAVQPELCGPRQPFRKELRQRGPAEATDWRDDCILLVPTHAVDALINAPPLRASAVVVLRRNEEVHSCVLRLRSWMRKSLRDLEEPSPDRQNVMACDIALNEILLRPESTWPKLIAAYCGVCRRTLDRQFCEAGLPRPIALSMPWTGKGVCTSHFEKPASRIFSAACMREAALSNSAPSP